MPLLKSETHPFGTLAIFAFLLTLIPVAVGFFLAYQEDGSFCYALDDSFIMMAMSKNLAQFGVWGATPHEFSNTASSPLFTVLLAAIITLTGDHIWIPLAVNLLTLFGLYFWLANVAKQWGFQPWQTWFLLMGISILAPVHVLIWGSMEHLLHLFISLLCIYQVIQHPKTTSWYIWILLGISLAGIRYEGLFLGSGIVLWFWANKLWKVSFLFSFGMMLPVFLLGIYALDKGSYFLPNSLMLKAINKDIQQTGLIGSYLTSWLEKAIHNPHALVMMVLLVLSLKWKAIKSDSSMLWIALVLYMSVLHFIFGRYNHVFRYEAYLMGAAWVALWKYSCIDMKINSLHSLKRFLFPNWAQTALVLFLAFSPIKRSAESMVIGTRGMVNIFEQQVQMGRFVHQFYDKAPLAAIDIGAICYLSQAHVLDVFGLASIEVARKKMADAFTYSSLDSLCHKKGVEVAIVHNLQPDTRRWHKVGSWVIDHNEVCGEDTVDFYGLTLQSSQILKEQMHLFQPKLPPTVRVCYY